MKKNSQIIYCCIILLFAVLNNSCKKEKVLKTYSKPEVTININDSRLNKNIIHLVKDTVYVLATNLKIDAGKILKIDAGTLVKVNDGLSVIINPGARIEAVGTSGEPIVFTSSAYKGIPGFVGYQNTLEHSWLGIFIYGNYPSPIDSTISGTGIIKYARIEFAGAIKQNYQGFPSLLLQNVGSGTILENIQVSYSVGNNSVEFSGGNANARNIVSYASGSSDFNLTNGYVGMMQNILAYRHPYFSPQLGSGTSLAGLLVNGDETYPAISNFTVLGPDLQSGNSPKYFDTTRPGVFGSITGSRVAALIISGGKFHIRNSAFLGFPVTGFYLDNYTSANSLLGGTSDFTYCTVQCPRVDRGFYVYPTLFPPYTSTDFKDFILQNNFYNQLYYNFSQLMITDPFNYDVNPNPFPLPGSPLLSNINYDGPVFSNSFFEKENYQGALGNNDWMKGWTNFIPLQTNYNN